MAEHNIAIAVASLDAAERSLPKISGRSILKLNPSLDEVISKVSFETINTLVSNAFPDEVTMNGLVIEIENPFFEFNKPTEHTPFYFRRIDSVADRISLLYLDKIKKVKDYKVYRGMRK